MNKSYIHVKFLSLFLVIFLKLLSPALTGRGPISLIIIFIYLFFLFGPWGNIRLSLASSLFAPGHTNKNAKIRF